jgi:hypothetical protein
MGPIDPESVDQAALSRALGEHALPPNASLAMLAATLESTMRASLSSPVLVIPASPTLSCARALDRELLALGLFSEIWYADSGAPGESWQFVDERSRSAAESSADSERRSGSH